MKTRVRKLDGLSIEEPVLDDEGRARQKALAEAVMRQYEESGVLTGRAVRERVRKYEAEIGSHVVDDEGSKE